MHGKATDLEILERITSCNNTDELHALEEAIDREASTSKQDWIRQLIEQRKTMLRVRGTLKGSSATQPSLPEELSSRENDIFQMIISGKSNDESATMLGISKRTVEKHCQSIFRKLKISGRHEAISRYGKG